MALEALELRRLLAADLILDAGGSSLPASVLVNTGRRGTVSVAVGNSDAVAFARTAPRIDVAVFIRLEGESALGMEVGRARNLSLSGLSNSRSPRAVKISVSIPKSTASGTYELVVVADPQNRLAETGTALDNNRDASPQKLTISPPFSRLVVTGVRLSPVGSSTLVGDGTARAVLTVRNDGNVAVAGVVDVSFVAASPAFSGTFALREVTGVSIKSLAVGKSVSIGGGREALIFRLPVNSSLTTEPFAVSAAITPRSLTTGSARSPVAVSDAGTTEQRRAVSPQFTLAPAGRTAASPLLPGLGKTLTFTVRNTFTNVALPGLNSETGDVVDELGRTGTFTFVYLPPAGGRPADISLSLTFARTATAGPLSVFYRVAPNVGVFVNSVKDRAVTFAVPAEESVGTVFANNDDTAPQDPGVRFKFA
jgi:hypothetical protein